MSWLGDQHKCWRPAQARAQEGSRMFQQSLGHSQGQKQAEKKPFHVTKSILFYTKSCRSCCSPSTSVPCSHLCVREPRSCRNQYVPQAALAYPPPTTQFGVNFAPKGTIDSQLGITEPAKPPPCPYVRFYRPRHSLLPGDAPHGTRLEHPHSGPCYIQHPQPAGDTRVLLSPITQI